MREIKFRIWDDTDKEMLYVDTLIGTSKGMRVAQVKSYQNSDLEYGWDYSDSDEVMQYTGLKDKNRVEIYEGDIVIQYEKPNKPYDVKQEIFFSDGMFCVGKKTHTETPLYLETKTEYRGKSVNLIEVVGNIYKNPELLETK